MNLVTNPAHTLEQMHARELNFFRNVPDPKFRILALLDYCIRHGIQVPEWVIRETVNTVIEDLNGIAKIRKKNGKDRIGRGANPATRYRYDQIHYMRYDMVCQIMDRQLQAQSELKELQSLGAKKSAPIFKDAMRMCDVFQTGADVAYELASEELRDTAARGSPASMKASYLRVKNRGSAPDEHFRYVRIAAYPLHPDPERLGPSRIRKLLLS